MFSGKYFQNLVLIFLIGLFIIAPFSVLAQGTGTFDQPVGSTNFAIPNLLGSPRGPAGQTSFGAIVLIVIRVALLVVGSVAVVFAIVGGFQVIAAHGNEEKAEAGKKTLGGAVLGLIIVLMSFAIITLIARIIIQGQP